MLPEPAGSESWRLVRAGRCPLHNLLFLAGFSFSPLFFLTKPVGLYQQTPLEASADPGALQPSSYLQPECSCPAWGHLCSHQHHLLTSPLPITFSLLFPSAKVASCPAKPRFPPAFPSPLLLMMDSKDWG